MKLAVFIPAYNEAKNIGKVVENIPRMIKRINRVDILVVDDGSVDNTAAEARAKGALVVRHTQNKRVGAAFHTALDTVIDKLKPDILVSIDADGQFNPQEIPYLLEPILEGRADFVIGSRFIDKDYRPVKPKNMSQVKFIGNKFVTFLVNQITGAHLSDVSSGFRAYSREAILNLNLNGTFTYTQEVIIALALKKFALTELPVKVRYFKDRKSRVASSITKYALFAGSIIFRTFRDFRPLLFFSLLAVILALVSLICGIFLLVHYLSSGGFSPYKAVGFAGLFFFGLALAVFMIGFVTDMLVRLMKNQEKIIYLEKRRVLYEY